MAGIAVAEGVAVPAGFEETRLPAGRHAVLVHRGPYEGLPQAWAWLGRMAPEVGPDDARRRRRARSIATPRSEVPPEELVTDICMPVARHRVVFENDRRRDLEDYVGGE